MCVLVTSPPPTGLHSGVHLPTAPPHFSGMEEMNVGTSRAKRYSSQRQRAVPEPAPPLHLGVMEGHYYEPSESTTHDQTRKPFPTLPNLHCVWLIKIITTCTSTASSS